ncbi:hypothetical protein H310_00572 [Aphanomyces invadans]|uniref:Uncharacterized protein n=1 Tax=Aphanomyces invadans TaxID=157072 RepID=A0A024UV36_9STRA|nr:hypothetical protein H310_00572 [Aphanomyces invadans]ETW10214.1 hypothetical protein H310_00572 [Aphanomyces invadans]|eukprot:XP_008861625.1 hypothetical protein H310_00572 [Aphanomyces invadans]
MVATRADMNRMSRTLPAKLTPQRIVHLGACLAQAQRAAPALGPECGHMPGTVRHHRRHSTGTRRKLIYRCYGSASDCVFVQVRIDTPSRQSRCPTSRLLWLT